MAVVSVRAAASESLSPPRGSTALLPAQDGWSAATSATSHNACRAIDYQAAL